MCVWSDLGLKVLEQKERVLRFFWVPLMALKDASAATTVLPVATYSLDHNCSSLFLVFFNQTKQFTQNLYPISSS